MLIKIFLEIKEIYQACINPSSLPQAGCDTRSIFSGVKLVWMQNFLSPRLVVFNFALEHLSLLRHLEIIKFTVKQIY